MGTLKIDALGTNFTIQAKEDDEYLENLLSYYKQMVKQIENSTSLKDTLKTSILAGIVLCDELYKEKCKTQNSNENYNLNKLELSEVERLTMKMIDNIDKVLD
ncbi:MAG: cell division protein ZapA [Treponema sp.]|nr:cell division protein ZapA [Treponema sp.]